MKDASLSRLPVRLNTLDRIKNDPELRRLYDSQYGLFPKAEAPELGGAAIKSLFFKPRSERKIPWVGKMGVAKSLEKPDINNDQSVVSWGTQNTRDMNEEVLKEKIACDAYRLFGDGLFATPKTRLSIQPIEDEYTKYSLEVQVYLKKAPLLAFQDDEVKVIDLPRPLTDSLRVMSKWIKGYEDFRRIKVPDKDNPEQAIYFMDYIKRYGHPSEHVIDPQSGKAIPIYGVMAVLAAATSLGDIDVLGETGANCGLIFLRNSNNEVYEALVVKIDPGFAFSYEAAQNANRLTDDERDIRYSTQAETLIKWKNLTQAQRDEFLEVKRHTLALNQTDILNYLFYRDGLWGEEISQPMTEQLSKTYIENLQDHLNKQSAIYQADLEEYEEKREVIIQEKAKKAYDKGNYDRAFNYYEKNVEIQKNKGDVNNVTLTASCGNLGVVYDSQGEFNDTLYEKNVEIQESKSGVNNLTLANSYNNLGLGYEHQGKFDEAIKYYESALAIYLVRLGEKHPDVAIGFSDLGNVYYRQGHFDLAIEYYKKALAIYLENFGEKYFDVAANYNNLGLVYLEQEQFEDAINYFKKALDILDSLDDKVSRVANSCHSLGIVYNRQSKFDLAIEYYQKALDIQLVTLDTQHPDVATTYHNLGNVYHGQEKFDLAIEYYEKALKIYLVNLDEQHPHVVTCLNNLNEARNKMEEQQQPSRRNCSMM